MSEPSFGHRKPIVREQTRSYKGWIIGGLIALGVFFVLFKMYSHSSNYTASITSGPATVTTVP
jgi:hypothetical protein